MEKRQKQEEEELERKRIEEQKELENMTFEEEAEMMISKSKNVKADLNNKNHPLFKYRDTDYAKLAVAKINAKFAD